MTGDTRAPQTEPPGRLAAGKGRRALVGVAVVVLFAAGLVTAAELRGGHEVAVLTGEALPAALADGSPLPSVPETMAAAADRPVVVALAVSPEAVPAASMCDPGVVVWQDEPAVGWAVLTPTELVADLHGTGAMAHYGADEPDPGQTQPLAARCHAVRSRATWEAAAGGASLTQLGDVDVPPAGGGGCCPAPGVNTAFQDLAVPPGAAWALAERPAYWLALPVGGATAVRVLRHFEEGSFAGLGQVRFLDEAGVVLESLDLG